MKSQELRTLWTEFWVARQHTDVPAAGLIPLHPSAPMFTNSGMMPFVPYFIGEEAVPYVPPRASSIQKCVRAGGKHNDLDAIGRSPRHLSFFEMLGNFSFGDYFKADAIRWAWELSTDVLGLDPERIWVTCHVDDDEAVELWVDEVGFPVERIQRLDKDNFWEMGDTGPCGPSSELFWDFGPELGPEGGPANPASEHRYGLTNADFGLYPVVARRHAATNPDAWFFGRPITLEEHQESRWIVEPILRLLDCCQESDGGVALVVTRADRAADLPNPGVAIAAASDGHVGGGDVMFNYYHGDLAEFPESIALGKRLYAQAGGGPADIDAAMIYENFSPVVFLQLEALGFCGPGEARDFIAEGNIDLDGALPVNPHGGLLGEAYIHGMNNIVEGVRQIRGTAANQLADPQRVMVVGGRSGLILEPV